jgi:hypothetical protein
MALIDDLLVVSKAYCDARKIVLPTLSAMMLRDSRTLDRLAAGASSITVRNFERCMDWLASNWPADTAWPEAVPRPFPSTTALPAPTSGSKPGSPAMAVGAGTEAREAEAPFPGTEAA